LEVQHQKVPGEDTAWKIFYSFTEQEAFSADVNAMNMAVFSMRSGVFWEDIFCSQYFFDDDQNHQTFGNDNGEHIKKSESTNDKELRGQLETRPLGRYSLEMGEFRKHMGGSSKLIRTIHTEEERLAVLKEVFGTTIPKENVLNMQGRMPALKF